MPDLPTITVTDAQYARLAAVLPGTTAAAKAAAYRAATREFWRQRVVSAEVRQAENDAAASIAAARADAAAHPDNL